MPELLSRLNADSPAPPNVAPAPRQSDVLLRLRRTPLPRLPGKAARFALRTARTRARRWGIERSRGELSDRALLRALGGRFPTVDAALAHFQGQRAPRFFFTPDQAHERAAALAAAFPDQAERTRDLAEQALAHVVDLLGSGPVSLGARINWHTDFKTGIGWPLAFYEDIDYLVLDRPCDVKVPWELSRCYHWVTLGRAYALDHDPRYAREFVAQVHAWLDDNPWPYGVNWGRAMEVAVRAVNWLWALALFADAPEVDNRTRLRLLKAFVQHGRHIAANLEFSHNNGNHYLSNGVGLLFLGLLLPEVVDAAAWLRKGQEIVWGEIERQVHPDGVDFEKGIGYQGLVAEFWYSSVLLADLNGLSVPPLVRERLERMFEFMLAYTRPDGTFPQVGDNDDGRLAAIDDEPVGSHRRHLGVGGATFGRPDLLGAAGEALGSAVWLRGPEVLAAPRATPEVASRPFPAGGFYVLRAPDAAMLVDGGEVGMNGIGGHGHNDLLSFDLWAAGAPLLVDPGTYTYTADPPARQALRATAAHNTVRVDGEEIARLGNERWLWWIEDDARPTVHTWRSDASVDFLDLEHDGYRRLAAPVTHRRRYWLDRTRRAWLIQDDLVSAGEHEFELFLHPAAPIVARGDQAFALRAPRADLWVVPLVAPAGTARDERPGWISGGYGLREPATVVRYAARATGPARFLTGLALLPAGASLNEARTVLDAAQTDDWRAAFA